MNYQSLLPEYCNYHWLSTVSSRIQFPKLVSILSKYSLISWQTPFFVKILTTIYRPLVFRIMLHYIGSCYYYLPPLSSNKENGPAPAFVHVYASVSTIINVCNNRCAVSVSDTVPEKCRLCISGGVLFWTLMVTSPVDDLEPVSVHVTVTVYVGVTSASRECVADKNITQSVAKQRFCK
jgi:hypothetical protein